MKGPIILCNDVINSVAKEVYEKIEDSYEFCEINSKRHPDGEFKPKIPVNVRRRIVCYMHGFREPDKGYIELFLVNDALKRASASEIINVLPYIPYLRQDRKDEARVPISAKTMAKLTEVSGATRILTSELHSGQIQGFYEIPVDNLYSNSLFERVLKKDYRSLLDKAKLVASDAGSQKRAEGLSDRLGGMELVFVYKTRLIDSDVETVKVAGEIEGYHAFMIDDMVDTGGTFIAGAKALREEGALSVRALATQAILSDKDDIPARERLEESLDEVIVLNTISKVSPSRKIRVVSVAGQYAEAIRRTIEGESLSELFE